MKCFVLYRKKPFCLSRERMKCCSWLHVAVNIPQLTIYIENMDGNHMAGQYGRDVASWCSRQTNEDASNWGNVCFPEMTNEIFVIIQSLKCMIRIFFSIASISNDFFFHFKWTRWGSNIFFMFCWEYWKYWLMLFRLVHRYICIFSSGLFVLQQPKAKMINIVEKTCQ